VSDEVELTHPKILISLWAGSHGGGLRDETECGEADAMDDEGTGLRKRN
jgi:hypothetical protein